MANGFKMLSVAQGNADHAHHCFVRVGINGLYLKRTDLAAIVKLWCDSTVTYNSITGMENKNVVTVKVYTIKKQFVYAVDSNELHLTETEFNELMDFITSNKKSHPSAWQMMDMPALKIAA